MRAALDIVGIVVLEAMSAVLWTLAVAARGATEALFLLVGSPPAR